MPTLTRKASTEFDLVAGILLLIRSAGPLGPDAPVNTVRPVISGTFVLGGTLSCTTGTWTGEEPITYAYQWAYALLDDNDEVLLVSGDPIGVAIPGATSSTYVIGAEYDDDFLFCVVTATNDGGSASADSNILP